MMNRLFVALIVLIAGTMPAAAVTIDFEEFNIGEDPAGGGYWFESQGYEFAGEHGPCGQFGCPAEILDGTLAGASGSNSFGAHNGWGGQDGYGAQVGVSMRQAGGGAFAIHSLDLLLEGCYGNYSGCFGSETISGTLAGGGLADLSVSVGTGDWLNLQRVDFRADGDGFGFGTGTVVEIDNINVSAVPIPAAVWLFGSALAGLGWLRRKQAA